MDALPPPADDTQEDLSVLIVDDEPTLATTLAAGLEAARFRPVVATSARDALRRVAEDPGIGVVITDIRMPDCDGLDLAQRVLAERPEATALEVIVISGHATLEHATIAVRARVSDLLCKPFRLSVAAKAVRVAMDRARQRRAEARRASRQDAQIAALEAERSQLLEWLARSHELLATLPDDPTAARAAHQEMAAISRTLRAPSAACPGPEDVQRLRLGVERSVTAVSLLEELSGLGAGAEAEEPAVPAPLGPALQEAWRFRQPEAREKGLVMQEAAAGNPVVLAPPRLLARTLDRCLQAAIDWAPPGSGLHLATHAEGPEGTRRAILDISIAPAAPAWRPCATAADAAGPPEGSQGLLAFHVAQRRAAAIGARLGFHAGGPGEATFRLTLAAAPQV